MKRVWCIAYEGPTPSMSGPFTTRMGEWTIKDDADKALDIVRRRSERSPKKNLRVQSRTVSEWEDA